MVRKILYLLSVIEKIEIFLRFFIKGSRSFFYELGDVLGDLIYKAYGMDIQNKCLYLYILILEQRNEIVYVGNKFEAGPFLPRILVKNYSFILSW